MKPHWFKLATAFILTFSLAIRLIPARENNFYFTMDQGYDAIQAREIFTLSHFPLLGPETSIHGLHAGPLWFYFIAIGYALFGGHPIGPLLLMILLNAILTFIIIRRVAKEVSPTIGLVAGTLLQISWWFYESSRFAFNPFPNTFLVFIGVFFLIDFFRGQEKKYALASIPFGLFFHTDIATAIPVNIFYYVLGLYLCLKRRLHPRLFLTSFLLLFLLLAPHFISELTTDFSQTKIFLKEIQNPIGVFAQTEVIPLKTATSITRGILRQIPETGFLIFSAIAVLLFKKIKSQTTKPFIKNITLITLGILFTTWAFFVTNTGWRDWHTAFLSPLILISIVLLITQFSPRAMVPLLSIITLHQIATFIPRYSDNLHPSNDPSLLINEIKAIDWAYANAKNQSFSVYIYIPSVYDYHYQYLFWWHGKRKYGYLPCEFNTFPGAPKTYLPKNHKKFETPKGNCSAQNRFLIMEPDKNNSIDNLWYQDLTKKTTLIEKTNIGKIILEKHILK